LRRDRSGLKGSTAHQPQGKCSQTNVTRLRVSLSRSNASGLRQGWMPNGQDLLAGLGSRQPGDWPLARRTPQ